MNVPLRFEPYLRPMVWGGRDLQRRLGKDLPTGEPYGESWEVSDHSLHRSIVVSGPQAGQSLRTLMEREPLALLGPAAKQHRIFPWLFKFLDVSDWLSVQVHPDAKKVKELWPGESSKTEAWFVLAAEPTSRIYAGLLPGVDERQLREAIREGTVVNCLHNFQPEPGDCVFLPAGTIHAAGGGVLLAEIQQTSDATFRLFDWNRRDSQGKPRQLHIEESIASIHWDQGPVRPICCMGFPSSRKARPRILCERQELVSCPYFDLEYVVAEKPFACGGENKVELLVVLEGKGRIISGQSEEPVERGQAWLLPAAMPHSWCQPETTVHALHIA
jgi:mannose-6-phosphate isomerase